MLGSSGLFDPLRLLPAAPSLSLELECQLVASSLRLLLGFASTMW